MTNSLLEFDDNADDDAGVAYGHVQKLISSGQSESLTALDKHWSKVQGKHKDLAKADRLVACRTPDGTLWRYTYDCLGRRTAKHRMAADGLTTVHSVYFTWDGTRLVEETDTSNGTTLTWDYDGRRPLLHSSAAAPSTPGPNPSPTHASSPLSPTDRLPQ
ncbi:RHS repeat domain-containing protein [Streptomyces sp. NPDC091376]|uniref:RHS repeat domain-containing protein n=1 Tax=Streptomyces sp. NPDC091376 TaxID=3365994 RepID=UPI0037FED521